MRTLESLGPDEDIVCRSEADYNSFMTLLEQKGYRWGSGDVPRKVNPWSRGVEVLYFHIAPLSNGIFYGGSGDKLIDSKEFTGSTLTKNTGIIKKPKKKKVIL